MTDQLPALVVVFPLFAAFAAAAAGLLNKQLCFPIAVAGVSGMLACSVGMIPRVWAGGILEYKLGGWAPPMGIVYVIDALNAPVVVAVAAATLLSLLSARNLVSRRMPDKIGPFYTLFLLFVTGLCGMTVTGDAFNLYVLLEIAALSGYALIGLGEDRAPHAALNYILLGTVGASFYLLGIGYLYIATGTLNMTDLAARLPELYESRTITFAFVLCLLGTFVKMAFFPFHGWLPNAYDAAPPAATGVIAPLTTKVMVYVMIRIMLTVFTHRYAFDVMKIDGWIVWMAVFAILFGSIRALSQRRLKPLFAYIIIAEVGYMVGGFWLGNRAGITGAVLHILNDAAMTLCVFLAAGAIHYRLKSDDFADFKGLFRRMPFTMAAFGVGALSIIGVPPTCGFFSKWYLLSGAIAAGRLEFAAALIFSSLVCVVLFFRVFEIAYFEPFHDEAVYVDRSFREAPTGMVVPLLISASVLILLGLWTGDIVTNLVSNAIPEGL